MKHFRLLTAFLAFSFFLLTGCDKEIDSTVNPASTIQANQVSKASAEKLSRLRASLPAGFEEQLRQSSAQLLQTDAHYRDLVRSALAIEPTPCDANTPMNVWLDKQLADWNAEIIGYVLDFAMLDLPTYEAYVFENSSENQYFGVDGEYTHQVTKAFKDLKRFWNIQSDDIVLAAMHGNMLQDRDKIIRTYVAVYGLSPSLAANLADIVVELVKVFPQYRGGDHPIFTFNAFAIKGFNYQPYANIPDKIIMGDGIMEAFSALGYGDIAPQAILAHEFGHHIQFQLNLFEGVRSPEATRRTELMADAYSAYYLSHARGASMQWKRVQQFLQVFFNIGDCSFTSTGHHGTPTQRMAAAEWGYNLANSAQKQGHILTSQEFTRLFEAQLPTLVKL
ncbi:neutral zinc metallopeptidase [Pontibacter liquoris]|uniref:neutral zinc metallopeptidase n=1 Tax=Pontibacter liquoris TaxID=2905677 RepID=UPI001FA6A9FB|nr:neutral zinc metallopeptidase [Pontibacter liquoris]